MRKNIFTVSLILFVISFLCSCGKQEKRLESKRTVIAGSVENWEKYASVVLVNYCDFLGDENRFSQELGKSGGTFHTVHDYTFSQNITLRYNNKFINLFVHPGDSVFVKIDAEKLAKNEEGGVQFFADNRTLNEQLFSWTDYIYKNIVFPEPGDLNTSDKYLSYIKQCLAVVRDSVDSYSKRHEMSDFVKQWTLIDHTFILANLYDYNSDINRWQVLTDSVFNVFDEKNFQTMYFESHLLSCLNSLMKDKKIEQLFDDKQYALAMPEIVNKIHSNAPEGTVRDAMLFLYFKMLLWKMPELCDDVLAVNNMFSQPVFDEKLKIIAEKNKIKHQGVNVDSISESELSNIFYIGSNGQDEISNVKFISYLANRYKNKTIYIDIWATWCFSCIEEMKIVQPLRDYFDNKDVVFINICLSSPVKTWKLFLEKYDIKGENFFFSENASELFMGENNIKGFPTYLLIDRNGKIKTASRPSELNSVIKEIEACL